MALVLVIVKTILIISLARPQGPVSLIFKGLWGRGMYIVTIYIPRPLKPLKNDDTGPCGLGEKWLGRITQYRGLQSKPRCMLHGFQLRGRRLCYFCRMFDPKINMGPCEILKHCVA